MEICTLVFCNVVIKQFGDCLVIFDEFLKACVHTLHYIIIVIFALLLDKMAKAFPKKHGHTAPVLLGIKYA